MPATRLTACAVVLALLFGMRAGDPSSADPPGTALRAEALLRAARSAQAATAGAADLLERAIDDARLGAARTIAGDDPPSIPLLAAADRLEAGVGVFDEAARAVASLNGVARAVSPAHPELAWHASALDVLSVAAQLRASAEAATAFVERRRDTDAVLAALRDALAALDAADPRSALSHLESADDPMARLRTWPQPPAVLAVWLSTSADLVAAAGQIAAATIAGDAAALETALQRYAVAARRAREADTALAIALSEAASATTSLPLGRLAGLLGDVQLVAGAIAGTSEAP